MLNINFVMQTFIAEYKSLRITGENAGHNGTHGTIGHNIRYNPANSAAAEIPWRRALAGAAPKGRGST